MEEESVILRDNDTTMFLRERSQNSSRLLKFVLKPGNRSRKDRFIALFL